MHPQPAAPPQRAATTLTHVKAKLRVCPVHDRPSVRDPEKSGQERDSLSRARKRQRTSRQSTHAAEVGKT